MSEQEEVKVSPSSGRVTGGGSSSGQAGQRCGRGEPPPCGRRPEELWHNVRLVLHVSLTG